MEDSTISIIGIIIASILMFLVPLIIIADRNDDIAQLTVKTMTAEYVDNIIKTGKITDEGYQKYIMGLETSGNTYIIDIEVKILDENTSKKTTNDTGEIGENSYYSIYTTQIEEKLTEADQKDDGKLNGTGKIILKEGDIISVTTKNSSKTLSQTLKSVYYSITGFAYNNKYKFRNYCYKWCNIKINDYKYNII